ncbi:hypothetical protein CDAR_428921 [Caerostris darwini]|uniref:Uncharacterized protein n=1 Tax=Caerostris darwini TaxID=1538125 RepID=A0AAV4V5T2_9ARAC|nr:hypothetical protein CDAR_428921 [Caerostris darwini]
MKYYLTFSYKISPPPAVQEESIESLYRTLTISPISHPLKLFQPKPFFILDRKMASKSILSLDIEPGLLGRRGEVEYTSTLMKKECFPTFNLIQFLNNRPIKWEISCT